MPKIRHQRKRPATQEERNAMTFAPINAEFDWTNEDWALTHLPVVRLALATVGHDDRGPEGVMSNIARAGGAVGLLDSFASTKQHLAALVGILDAALARSFLVLERLGYSPDKPPPDTGAESFVSEGRLN